MPLLVARQVDLRKLALMEYDDFKALEDENDASTRVARGPQLKIKHYCKRKMKELGVEIELGKEEAVDCKKRAGHEGDSEGKCHVCWEKEIQIIFCPCGHEACCVDCGKALEGGPCPICRAPVKEAARAFKG
ncbi:unnamed protein product [Ectocarpus sp. 12 AP-2014]